MTRRWYRCRLGPLSLRSYWGSYGSLFYIWHWKRVPIGAGRLAVRRPIWHRVRRSEIGPF